MALCSQNPTVRNIRVLIIRKATALGHSSRVLDELTSEVQEKWAFPLSAVLYTVLALCLAGTGESWFLSLCIFRSNSQGSGREHTQNTGAWVAHRAKRLPSAWVMIPGSWDQAPHQAPCSARSLLLPLPLPLPSNKYNLLKTLILCNIGWKPAAVALRHSAASSLSPSASVSGFWKP